MPTAIGRTKESRPAGPFLPGGPGRPGPLEDPSGTTRQWVKAAPTLDTPHGPHGSSASTSLGDEGPIRDEGPTSMALSFRRSMAGGGDPTSTSASMTRRYAPVGTSSRVLGSRRPRLLAGLGPGHVPHFKGAVFARGWIP